MLTFKALRYGSQFCLQIPPYRPLHRKRSPDGVTDDWRGGHLIAAYSTTIYRPRKDERLSWPSWLTYRGRFTHISGYPSAAGRAQDRESSPVKERRYGNRQTDRLSAVHNASSWMEDRMTAVITVVVYQYKIVQQSKLEGQSITSFLFTTSSSAIHVTSMRVTSGGRTGNCASRCKPSLRYGMTAPLRTIKISIPIWIPARRQKRQLLALLSNLLLLILLCPRP